MNGDELFEVSFPMTSADVAQLVRTSVPHPRHPRPATHAETPCVVCIGAFDGVHQGHRSLVAACVREAHAMAARAVAVTFDPDPSELFSAEGAEPQLLSISDRVCLLQELGIDEVLVFPFDHALAARTPEAFVELLEERLGPVVSVHVGKNFRFGARGAGDVATLEAIGTRRGFDVRAHSLACLDGKVVSSTRVRALLARGEVGRAASLLGRCHFVRGWVDHGRGEGTSFGFPTANVRTAARTCMPSEGVYACIVSDGEHAWPAAANVGTPPTFESRRDACFLEANLIGFTGDLYGRELSVVFVAWLRASRPFSSLDELERTVLGNIDWVRHNVGDGCVEVAP